MLEFKYQTKYDLQKQLKDYWILFAYHSNRIENRETDFYDVKEVFEK